MNSNNDNETTMDRKIPCTPGAPLTALTTLAAIAASALLLLAGCASPGSIAPTRTLIDATAVGATAAPVSFPGERWWQAYGDADLDALVERALAGTPTLAVAEARLAQARAFVSARDADRAPLVTGAVDVTYQRYTERGLIPPPLAGKSEWNVGATINGSWEVDLFGRRRAALDAAIGSLRAADADAQAARVLLATNVAAGWFNLARLVDARDVVARAITQRDRFLDIVRQRVGAGLDTNVELRQAEGQVAQARVDAETLDEGIARARHALAELTGQGPDALAALAPHLSTLAGAPLPATLPADLLGRRADLAAQRWRVEAASREVDVARAEFYPNLNLVAFAGLSSLGLDRFVNFGARQYGAGPALTLPIFEGGRLRANLSARAADVDAAVETWNGTLLRALREVADEVSSLRSLDGQESAQADATAAADAAYDLAMQRYRAGLGNFLSVLTAQTNVLVQQRASVELKARHLSTEVALARALGGGWRAADPQVSGGWRAADRQVSGGGRAADRQVSGGGRAAEPVAPVTTAAR